MLIIKNLTKKFNNQPILNNVSITVQKGEIALLLGESGVGKSTLLRILATLETADSGEVIIDGTVVDASERLRNHMVSMVFQQFNLFDHLTVQENITLALELVLKKRKKDAQEIAHKLLKQFDLLDKAALPVSRLSGGQKQRLAIARALAMNPKILCADEPTSALDPLLTDFVAHTLQQLADQGISMIIASHDIALISHLRCTIYLMKAGSIIQTAKSWEFNNNREAYSLINAFVGANR